MKSARNYRPRLARSRLKCLTRSIDRSQLVQAVKRGYFVSFSKRRIVEHHVAEVIDCTAESHNRLANVNQFRGAFPENMHGEQLPRLAMENDLQDSAAIADDLSTRELAVSGEARLKGDLLFGEL